jgi:hypothetical protein
MKLLFLQLRLEAMCGTAGVNAGGGSADRPNTPAYARVAVARSILG